MQNKDKKLKTYVMPSVRFFDLSNKWLSELNKIDKGKF